MPDDANGKAPQREHGGVIEQLRGIWRRIGLEAVGALVYGGVDRRLELSDAIDEALRHRVPRHVNWTYCFGGITFFLFLVLAGTGILLTLYYRPSSTDAYESVKYIMNDVRFGWLIRSMHHWAANLMTLTIIIHMARVYFHGAYKHPRELNWIAGMFLLALTLAFGFTGYLLPWDQKAYWGTTVGTRMPAAMPIIGDFLKLFLRGGDDVTGRTLSRFYSLHVVLLPMVTTFFLVSHFVMIRRQGISKPM